MSAACAFAPRGNSLRVPPVPNFTRPRSDVKAETARWLRHGLHGPQAPRSPPTRDRRRSASVGKPPPPPPPPPRASSRRASSARAPPSEGSRRGSPAPSPNTSPPRPCIRLADGASDMSGSAPIDHERGSPPLPHAAPPQPQRTMSPELLVQGLRLRMEEAEEGRRQLAEQAAELETALCAALHRISELEGGKALGSPPRSPPSTLSISISGRELPPDRAPGLPVGVLGDADRPTPPDISPWSPADPAPVFTTESEWCDALAEPPCAEQPAEVAPGLRQAGMPRPDAVRLWRPCEPRPDGLDAGAAQPLDGSRPLPGQEPAEPQPRVVHAGAPLSPQPRSPPRGNGAGVAPAGALSPVDSSLLRLAASLLPRLPFCTRLCAADASRNSMLFRAAAAPPPRRCSHPACCQPDDTAEAAAAAVEPSRGGAQPVVAQPVVVQPRVVQPRVVQPAVAAPAAAPAAEPSAQATHLAVVPAAQAEPAVSVPPAAPSVEPAVHAAVPDTATTPAPAAPSPVAAAPAESSAAAATVVGGASAGAATTGAAAPAGQQPAPAAPAPAAVTTTPAVQPAGALAAAMNPAALPSAQRAAGASEAAEAAAAAADASLGSTLTRARHTSSSIGVVTAGSQLAAEVLSSQDSLIPVSVSADPSLRASSITTIRGSSAALPVPVALVDTQRTLPTDAARVGREAEREEDEQEQSVLRRLTVLLRAAVDAASAAAAARDRANADAAAARAELHDVRRNLAADGTWRSCFDALAEELTRIEPAPPPSDGRRWPPDPPPLPATPSPERSCVPRPSSDRHRRARSRRRDRTVAADSLLLRDRVLQLQMAQHRSDASVGAASELYYGTSMSPGRRRERTPLAGVSTVGADHITPPRHHF